MADKPINNLLTDDSVIPDDLLTDEQARAFFDQHKAHRTTLVEIDGHVVPIPKHVKSQYNSWLWTKVGAAQSRAKRVQSLKVKEHESAQVVPTGALRQHVKARGRAKSTQDAEVHSAMYDAILEELRSKGVDLSVLESSDG